ncbi:MAG: hypothetical protein JJT76_19160 [Clostridiaceae bacterium]|nr:hypothetical protein [Clostridiaceae bacterium]
MKMMGIWGLLTILFLFAMVTTGVIERILWVLVSILIILQYIKQKRTYRSRKEQCKKISIGILTGYILSIICLVHIQYHPQEIYVGRNYVPQDKSAIILVIKSEPPHYDMPLIVKNHRDHSSFWTHSILPFTLFRDKLNYEKIDGGLNYNYGRRLQYHLNKKFQETFTVYIAYSHTKPYLDEVINLAMAEGNQRIILTPVFLTESKDFKAIENKVTQINPSQYKIDIKTTKPLWDSEAVATSFVEQVNHFNSSSRKENIGVILVGKEVKKAHGDSIHIKQDLLFRDKVKDFLVVDGYNKNKIRLTSFDKKNIVHEAQALMEYGVGEIIVVPTSTSLQKIKYKIILERAINSIKTPYAVRVYTIDPWNFNDYVIEELLNRIELLNLSI